MENNFKAIVLHETNPTFGWGAKGHIVYATDFTHVSYYDAQESVTESDFLNEVFEKTNSIDHGWWENEGVELIGKAKAAGGARSTSVGDIVIVCRGDSEKVYRVAPCGFDKVILKYVH